MLLLAEVAEVTDTDVADGCVVVIAVDVLGGDAIAVQAVVDEGADLVVVAYAAATLDDSAAGVGGARDEMCELEVDLRGLVHDKFGIALEAEIVHLCHLLGQVLADVFVERELFDGDLSEGRYQLGVLAVCIHVECAEDGPALLELEGDECDDVEGCVVDSTMADRQAGSDADW